MRNPIMKVIKNYLAAGTDSAGALASLKFNCATGLMSCSADASVSIRLPLFTNTINKRMMMSGTKKLANTMMINCLGDFIRLPCASLIGLLLLDGL